MDLVINFTPTGMVPTRETTPHAPLRVDEIVEDVFRAVEIGITTVHLHARDEITGIPTCSAETYGKIIEGIRSFSQDLVICVSLSGRVESEVSLRAAPLSLTGSSKPDMGSLTLGSLNFPNAASVNAPATIKALAGEMQQRNILPELEVFDLGMINYAHYLERKGVIKSPHYFNLIFGNICGAQAKSKHLELMVDELPETSVWSAGGIGEAQVPTLEMAVAAGGGVRVGLEDNIWLDRGNKILATNADLLNRVHALAESAERKVMSPQQFREKLNLAPGNGDYGLRS